MLVVPYMIKKFAYCKSQCEYVVNDNQTQVMAQQLSGSTAPVLTIYIPKDHLILTC